MNPEDRTTILVAGGRELAEHTGLFSMKGLRLEPLNLEDLTEASAPKRFASAKALMVAERPGKFGSLSDVFSRVAPWAVAEGVAIACFSHVRADLRLAEKMVADSQVLKARENGPRWVYLDEDIQNLAEMLGRHKPGPGTGSAEIIPFGEEFELPDSHQHLMRRAFWDANDIRVQRLPGGASSPGAYCVYASLRTAYGQHEPTPFVFKVDQPQKISKECDNYRDFVQPFVPFHLRPGLIETRLIETPKLAALTCNFVEGAIPLETALSTGHGAGAIFSLFETTLRRFRHQAHSTNSKPNVISDYIRECVKVGQLYEDQAKLPRIELARQYNFNGEPRRLQEEIARAANGVESLYVFIHGDLHMGNVMVRHKDSIVIDFGSMRHEGPLTADPASLEASIAFGTRKDESPNDQKEWFKFIDQIYQNPLELPVPTSDHIPFAWVNRAIREVRQIVRCCGVSNKDALLVLAASLLRYARFSKPSFNDLRLLEISEERKAYALVKAQQVFEQVT
jgi:hypothetical protein